MINNENIDKLINFINNMKENEIEELNEALEEFKKANSLKAEQDNPFDVKNGEKAYFNSSKYMYSYDVYWDRNELYDYVPCKDKSIVEQRQKRHHLNDLLEKFAYENNANVTEEDWEDTETYKYHIYEKTNAFRRYDVGSYRYIKITGTIFFKSREAARRAINEVVVPFMEDKKE